MATFAGMSRVTEHMRQNMAGKMLSLLSLEGGMYGGPIPIDADTALRFRLGAPGPTGMGVTDIYFLAKPERVVITGDMHPALGEAGGVISNPGYGLGWFARPQGEQYLAEKFLRAGYYPQIAQEWLAGWVKDCGATETLDAVDRRRHVDHATEADFATASAFADFLENTLEIEPDHDEGVGYDPKVVGWLAAIQARFTELFGAMFAGTPEEQRAAVNHSYWVVRPENQEESPKVVALFLRQRARKLREGYLRLLPANTPGVADVLAERAAPPAEQA